MKKLLSEFGVTNCVELDWWQSYHYIHKERPTSAEIIFTPAKHWTARSAFDRNTCLWGKSLLDNLYIYGL